MLRHQTVILEYYDFSVYHMINSILWVWKKSVKLSALNFPLALLLCHQCVLNSESTIVFCRDCRALGQPCLRSRFHVSDYTSIVCTQVMPSSWAVSSRKILEHLIYFLLKHEKNLAFSLFRFMLYHFAFTKGLY